METELSPQDFGILILAGVAGLAAAIDFARVAEELDEDGLELGDHRLDEARDGAGRMVLTELFARGYTPPQLLSVLRGAIRDFHSVHPRLTELHLNNPSS